MSALPLDLAAQVVLQRWRCEGHDRLYVRAGGRDLGYRDLRTGDAVCDDSADLAAVRHATARTFERIAEARDATDRRPQPGRPDEADEGAGPGLGRLGPRWHVRHAVPVGSRGREIDHLVIGPGGVFAITVQDVVQASVRVGGDTVKINGANRPCVRDCRHAARRATKLLTTAAGFTIEVRGAVAVVGARALNVKRAPVDVTIMSLDGLVRWLRDAPAVLDPPTVDRIHSVTRHLSGWQPTTVAWGELAASG